MAKKLKKVGNLWWDEEEAVFVTDDFATEQEAIEAAFAAIDELTSPPTETDKVN